MHCGCRGFHTLHVTLCFVVSQADGSAVRELAATWRRPRHVGSATQADAHASGDGIHGCMCGCKYVCLMYGCMCCCMHDGGLGPVAPFANMALLSWRRWLICMPWLLRGLPFKRVRRTIAITHTSIKKTFVCWRRYLRSTRVQAAQTVSTHTLEQTTRAVH